MPADISLRVATHNKISHQFPREKACRPWVVVFTVRHHQLTSRTPEPKALACCSAFNGTQVNPSMIIYRQQFSARPNDMYNTDETGGKTSACRPPRVISVESRGQVWVVPTAEEGQLTTIIWACSVTGHFIPPYFIFGQRKRMNVS